MKLTKKQVKNANNQILSVGYGSMQNLLKGKKRLGFSSGINGWSCDYYLINDVMISTGYNPLKNKNMNDYGYKELKEMDDKAKNILDGQMFTKDYDSKLKEVNQLLTKFIDSLKVVDTID